MGTPGDQKRQGPRVTRALSLRTSTAQGGTWFAKTAYGALEGYLTAELGQTSSVPRIMSIEAGAVGCPAATP